MTRVFIDGSAGTTGLRIYERLADRKDIELILLPEDRRKVTEYRQEAICRSDITFLCLPDRAAAEAVRLAEGSDAVIIDASSAHRTDPDFVYGFPEIVGYEAIAQARRITNPGCHSSGFIALICPLVRAGLLDPGAKLTCFSLTGYSGRGRKMVLEYESKDRPKLCDAPRQYGLDQQHKHLKEMVHVCGLENAPLFSPVIGNYYSGMEVCVPLFGDQIRGDPEDLARVYEEFYHTGRGLVRFHRQADEEGYLSAAAYAGRDDMEISVHGNPDRILLTARLDNLGKGASGAAVQNMNIIMGVPETTGLVTG